MIRSRTLFWILLFFCAAVSGLVRAQCVGLPSVTSLGSNKLPTGLCAPVQTDVSYTIAFAAPVAPGDLQVVYDWGDGTAPEIVPLLPGSKNYQTSRSHEYPAESDCEYFVSVAVRYNGKLCTNTLQLQKISSWRTDAFNGGDVKLISPSSKNGVHLVCEGDDISVIFDDATNWNCNTPPLLSGADPIESPNTEYRWQQIVYNTGSPEKKIPNVSVDGAAVTGDNGIDILSDYQDPRGVFFMNAPVLFNDSRRRSSLHISAPGGFGEGHPQAGDSFSVTLRYWNFCNPYDDPEIPGPPLDKLNGDHPPVEKLALIRVVAPAPPLQSVTESVCHGVTPSAFKVTGVVPGNQVNWYRYIPGQETAGQLISSSTSTSLPVASHPDWKGNKTPGILRVWAAQKGNVAGETNCESPLTLVTRMIRENLIIPDPITVPPVEICNGESFSLVMPQAMTESTGGETEYVFKGSSGITISSSGESSATYAVQVTDFGAALFADRTISVTRQYVDAPVCGRTKSFKMRIYRDPVGGRITGNTQTCELGPVGELRLEGFVGTINDWQIKKDDGPFLSYSGAASENTISPGILSPGLYAFRAVVSNGTCTPAYSDVLRVEVSADPGLAQAGEDQFICNALQSAELNASMPVAGTGKWTYLSGLPQGLPPPVFDPGDPNTTVLIQAEHAGIYTLRWTVTNGPCVSFDDVIIDFGTTPTDPNAGPDRGVCGPSGFLEGNVPSKGQGVWTVVRGPGGCLGDGCGVLIQDPGSPTSGVELLGPAFSYGSYVFRWNISSGGNNCFLKSDEVTLTFEEPVTVSANDVTDICLDYDNPEPVEVKGFVKGDFKSAQWEKVTGAGTISTTTSRLDGDASSVSAIYQPSADDYASPDPVDLKLMIFPVSASCPVLEKVITLSMDKKPIAIAGTDVDVICQDHVALNAALPLPGLQGMWRTEQPGVSFDDPTNPQTIARNLPFGATNVTWTVASDAGCVSRPSTISLTRVPKPVVQDLELTECAGDGGVATSIVLVNYEGLVTSLETPNRQITWFRNEIAFVNRIANPTAPQIGVQDGQLYVAEVRDTRTGCTSHAKVTIRVRPLPSVGNAVITQCEDVAGSNIVMGVDLTDNQFVGAITSETNVDVVWYNSEADLYANRFAIVAPVIVSGQKEFFARVMYRDAPFCSAVARLNIAVSPQPAITRILGRESVCQGIPSSSGLNDFPVHIYQVAPIPGAKYYWEIPTDNGSQFKVFGGGGERDFYVMLQFPNVYTGKIKVRAQLDGCSGPVVEKQIAVSAAPQKPIIAGGSVVCSNGSLVAFSVIPNNYPSSVYNWEVRRVSDNSTGGADIVEGQLTGNVLVNFGDEDVVLSVRESNADCVSPVTSRVVRIAGSPKATLSIEKQISCFMAGDGAIKTTVAGGSAPYTDFQIIETQLKDDDDDGLFTQLGHGSYTVQFRDANGCIATSNVQVLRQPEPLEIERLHIPSDAHGFNVSCADASDGQIFVTFSGGNDTGDYTASVSRYGSVDPPVIQKGRAGITFNGLSSGTYSVVVKDEVGCTSVPAVAFIMGPQTLYGGIIGPDQVIGPGDDPARIDELSPPQGGTGIYEYEWQESMTGNVDDDAAWRTIPGATDRTFDPPPVSDMSVAGEQQYYRRIVKSVSYFKGTPQVCEVAGRRQRVAIGVADLEASFSVGALAACAPATLDIQNTTKGADVFSWKLFRGDTLVGTSNLYHPHFEIVRPGSYDLQLTASVSATGEHDESRVRGIIVLSSPRASFEVRTDLIYVPDTRMEVMNFSIGANRYEWRFGDGNISDEFEPQHAFEVEGRYTVVLTAGYDHGPVNVKSGESLVCYDTVTRVVTALNGGGVRIPNAFTPDTRGQGGGRTEGRGMNDVFLPATTGIRDFHMQIYDRWGVLVFESHDKEKGWDGYDRNHRLLPAGVYVYRLTLRTSAGENVTRIGDVALIR